ncbi:o-succinylbenzoate synthase [Veillonella intestinalis]|uniref:o-succinylbenzoate synthase n=1 Tax=Veillonella intestinalis TaxID=2941341 RepID=UPI00203C44B7|nr:o-succinylbenzoate synthase [Veillonella intestinalis]
MAKLEIIGTGGKDNKAVTHKPAITIATIKLWHIALPLRFTFKTAQGTVKTRESLIIEVTTTTGYTSYGEVVAFTDPFYTAETLSKSKQILETTWLPFFIGKTLQSPWDCYHVLPIEANALRVHYPMAWAGLENALLHAYYGEQGLSTIDELVPGHKNGNIASGVVLGDMPISELLTAVATHEAQGCDRIKLKLTPRDAVLRVQTVREAFPQIILAGDANCSFSLEQVDDIIALNAYNLRSLEEPFQIPKGETGVTVYASLPQSLRKAIQSPICFDESVQSLRELQAMYETGWLDLLNIKIGRLGGLRETLRCLAYCREKQIGYWIGSMVESGISKYMHVQLAALADTWMAGDLSDMNRYFERDIITTPIQFQKGYMPVDFEAGLGTAIDTKQLKAYALDCQEFC